MQLCLQIVRGNVCGEILCRACVLPWSRRSKANFAGVRLTANAAPITPAPPLPANLLLTQNLCGIPGKLLQVFLALLVFLAPGPRRSSKTCVKRQKMICTPKIGQTWKDTYHTAVLLLIEASLFGDDPGRNRELRIIPGERKHPASRPFGMISSRFPCLHGLNGNAQILGEESLRHSCADPDLLDLGRQIGRAHV